MERKPRRAKCGLLRRWKGELMIVAYCTCPKEARRAYAGFMCPVCGGGVPDWWKEEEDAAETSGGGAGDERGVAEKGPEGK